MDQDSTRYGFMPRPTRPCLRQGPSSPSPKGAQPPIFGQCPLCPNGWMTKMPLGLEVGLHPGDYVFGATFGATTFRKKSTPTRKMFGPCLLWPNGWMDEDAAWYGSRPRPRPYCIRRGPSSPRKGPSSPPSFRPMSIVATVTHFSYC